MMRAAVGLLSLMLGLTVFGSGLWMGGKAIAAQILLGQAWEKSLERGRPISPWNSMDAKPVAKVSVPALNKSVIVFDSVSGQTLAFGPGFMTETAPLGTSGTSAIAAHKNTHFAFLKNLSHGQEINLQLVSGDILTYRVSRIEIVNADTGSFTVTRGEGIPSELALITCYPFDAISFGGPLRYIVRAERV